VRWPTLDDLILGANDTGLSNLSKRWRIHNQYGYVPNLVIPYSDSRLFPLSSLVMNPYHTLPSKQKSCIVSLRKEKL